jgi:cell division protein FtsI (penicillin-binding protein 3)
VSARRRLVVLLCVLCLLFGVVLVRLTQLQLLNGDPYVSLGQSQTGVQRPVVLSALRGSIFDRNGVELAMSVTQQTVWADPRLVSDPKGEAEVLAPVLGVDAPTLQSRLSQAAKFVYLARQVPDDVAAQVDALELDGVFLVDEPSRELPAGDLARGVVGSVDIDGVGIAGLELQFDDLLTGTNGEMVLERSPDGRTIATGRHQYHPATPGDDLVVSIDSRIQFEAERAVAEQVEAMGAKGGIAIVTRPDTGEILAMANVERPESGGPAVSTGNNRAITTVFEPGSANKVITMAATLEEGLGEPGTVLSVPDRLQVADHEFSDHDPHDTADWTLTDIMATSSNIGTIMLAQQLGAERLDEYLRRFGFGAGTGLGFPNESAGLLLPIDQWSGTSIGSIPLGQGIAVTALQMLGAYNVIANSGELVAPRLVLGRVDERGRRHETEPAERSRVVSERTADDVRDMLVAVVEQGTGRKAAIDGYHVAGKTGTARKPLPTGGYRDGAGNYHYVASFTGFVPAEDPKLSVIVVIDEPSATIYASGAAAPVFARIASYALRQLRIPPPAEQLPGVGGELTVDLAENSANEVPGGRTSPPTTAPPTTVAPADVTPTTATGG